MILMIAALNQSGISGKIHVDHVTKFMARPFNSNGLVEEDRLGKRTASLTNLDDSMLLEFEGIGKKFGVWLEPHDSIILDKSTIRIHSNDGIVEEPISGKAYVGRKVVVVDKRKKRYNMAAMVRSSSPDDDAFAHFYIEPTKYRNLIIRFCA